ncbi:orn arg lys decarboxylase putative [Entamoeba histolytica]|uniref:Orn arg lys decarboxylase putative n=2 Tax=Entamoeba TaxID=5758 RepID=A0A175JIK4_ENTHI|nr:orn arg lys decarboxylase putative [Entamoeba histolytica]
MEDYPIPRIVDENTFVREITATDHINKSLAEAYLKHLQETNQEFDSIDESEEWEDPIGVSCMSIMPEGEDTRIYLHEEKEENN